MKRVVSLLAFCGLLALPVQTSAQNFAVAANVGTLGLGGSAIFGATPKLNVRATFGVVPGEPEFAADELDFTVSLPTRFRLTADYYPTGFFYLSAGGLFASGGGDIEVLGTFTGSQEFGGMTYSASEVGTLTGVFGMSSAMPYLGIGFGNPVKRGIGVHLDLGVGFGSVPTVDLDATGPIASDPGFIADLNAEEAQIAEDIPEFLRYYPVLNLAVSFGFGG